MCRIIEIYTFRKNQLQFNVYKIHIRICDAARQNQALFARLRSEVELSLQAYPQKVENEFPTESVS